MKNLLRNYADFNSVEGNVVGVYALANLLSHRMKFQMNSAGAFGRPVALYYEDDFEEFEVSTPADHKGRTRWRARTNWKTIGHICG